MDTPPGKVIRSLRQALSMTQAEFARAAGWSASTISSWERGTTQPSRVAFKTILAFAEAHGVRYQTKVEGTTTSDAAAPNPGTLPVLRLSSRLPTLPPVLARDAGREESLGSRRWTEVAADGLDVPIMRARTVDVGERADWQVDARLQVRIGAGSGRLQRTGLVAATVLALAVGVGTGIWLRSGFGSHPAARLDVSRPLDAPAPAPLVASAPNPAPPVEVDELALTALAAPALGEAPPFAADAPADPANAASEPAAEAPALPPPAFARLESIVALDGVRRATFRVGDRSIALVEGDALGGRTVATIGNRDVTLVGEGAPKRVRLGFDAPLD
jgi:transcriptional regulator with XRE-family HTH domain